MAEKQKKAAVYMMLGQSNAVGHILPMRDEDIIREPMKNVFGLSRTLNQSYTNEKLRWTGYTSFDMNLAEEQDNTYSVPNCLARLWQDAVDSGEDLPDLYIVHIAIGAEGITERFMWYPDRPEKLVPGPLGTVDISMYPLALHVFSLLSESFREMGKDFEIIGIHWRGGEEDTDEDVSYLRKCLPGIYHRMFREFREAIGKDVRAPFILHLMACPDRCLDQDPSGESLFSMGYLNALFMYLSRKEEDVTVFDPRRAPQFVPNVRGNGIFLDIDVVHFKEEVNRWAAQTVLDEYRKE